MTTDSKTFIGLFQPNFKETRKDLVLLARSAETAERYSDMCKFMASLVEWAFTNKADLTVEERNLLSVAYKNVIGARRAAWRTLNADEHKDDDLIKVYKKQVESELDATCQEVLHLLTRFLLQTNTAENESRIFYLKMSGDYYRYLAEFVTDQSYDTKARDNYENAYTLAQKILTPTHPIRLGLALNFSVCYYEVLKDKAKACSLAKAAFDSAIAKLDKLDEASYKDSTLIMQLLRDNLTLWQSDSNEQLAVEDATEANIS